jgi:hypothetical protein
LGFHNEGQEELLVFTEREVINARCPTGMELCHIIKSTFHSTYFKVLSWKIMQMGNLVYNNLSLEPNLTPFYIQTQF